jgi:muramoyltetrapeptide carboxypeptidase LdcA involved in peptidoglycan recycling
MESQFLTDDVKVPGTKYFGTENLFVRRNTKRIDGAAVGGNTCCMDNMLDTLLMIDIGKCKLYGLYIANVNLTI